MARSKGMGGGPSMAFEKPRAGAKAILRRLWRYLYHYKWLLAAAVALSLTGNLLALAGPKLSGYAIDAIRPGPGRVDFTTVFHYAKRMLVFYFAAAALSYVLATLMVRLSRNVVYRMRKDIYDHLMRLPVRFFDTHAIGDVLSVLSYDVDTINASLSNDLVQMLTSVITVAGSFGMMLSISPQLILIFVVTIPISVMFTRHRSKRVRPLYRRRSAGLGALNGFAEEMTGGLKTIKAYGREEVFLSRFEEKNRLACDANYEADAFSSSTGPGVNFINNLSLALVSLFGALLYMAGGISLGSVSSFVLYSRKFSGPINEFANIISELQSALAAAERVFQLLDEAEEAPDAPGARELSGVRGAVALRGVRFGYGGAPVLDGFTLAAQPGQVVAIVGPTGAGKTTVINLLMRFYDADSGSITVDGQEILSLTRASLRRDYSMVLQDTWLFNGTIRENIRYGRPDATDAEVEAAARAARCDHFIHTLAGGYDFMINEEGTNLSQGQRQLVTIARAILADRPALILDEATSNVDTRTEELIQRAMDALMQGRTSFVIAHRLSTIRNADVILVIRDGDIVEKGTHDELLAQGGFYADLYNSQFDEAA